MKTWLFSLTLTLALSASFLGAQDDVAPSTAEKDGSYAFGAQFASQFKEGEIVIDEFIAGFRDKLESADLRLSEEALSQAFNAWQQSIQQKRAAEAAEAGQENLQAAETFLKANEAKEGVEATESGLQYMVIEEGEGDTAEATDNVRVHYNGAFLDGEVFDSSIARGEPIETPVSNVIPGWQEGLQLMNKGSKYRFFIHPKLAYGEQGNARIPPNSLLVFDVEMIDILGAATPPAAIPPVDR